MYIVYNFGVPKVIPMHQICRAHILEVINTGI